MCRMKQKKSKNCAEEKTTKAAATWESERR
jgi:hypothetical protein